MRPGRRSGDRREDHGNETRETDARWGLAMSARPFHPQGFCQHWETSGPVSGMGKRITFSELPADCQKAVVSDYKEVWAIE